MYMLTTVYQTVIRIVLYPPPFSSSKTFVEQKRFIVLIIILNPKAKSNWLDCVCTKGLNKQQKQGVTVTQTLHFKGWRD